MNPYEVLGLNPGASQDEIKSAYRKLIKQYHPDKFIDNPLQDLAEEKMRQINEAYDMLTKNGGSNSYTNTSYNSSSTNYNNSNTYSNNYNNNSEYEFQDIRMMIQRRDFANAESRLNSINNRNAEWHFLYGAVMLNKGWYDSALEHMNTAVSMDPNNFEYRQGLNALRQRGTGFTNPYYRTTSRSNDTCDICIKLWCLDSLCECAGCDLIGCC